MGFWSRIGNLFRRKEKKEEVKETFNIPANADTVIERPLQQQRPIPRKKQYKEETPFRNQKVQQRPINRIQETIDHKRVNGFESVINQNTPLRASNSDVIESRYGKLLKDKINDPILFKQLTGTNPENKDVRNLLLRDRISMKITCLFDKTTGQLEISGILPEEEEDVKTHFVNKTIGSSGWYELINTFQAQTGIPVKFIKSLYEPRFGQGDSGTIKSIKATTTFQ